MKDDSETCSRERLDRDALMDDETTLAQVFGLLVWAHYRTRPFDLRQMLDAPEVSVQVLRHGESIVATALVAEEGGLDAPLAHEELVNFTGTGLRVADRLDERRGAD